ncbi:bZIP_ATF6 domain-containing protein ATf6 isoform X2 [Lycorma delicatula]
MDCDISPSEDFLHELSNDLEIPMLLEESQHFKENDNFMESSALLDNLDVWTNDTFDGITDSVCEIKEEVNDIKYEPNSPASSQSSVDSWSSSDREKKVVLETPPISPPESVMVDNSPPLSPASITVTSNATRIHQQPVYDSKPVIICNSGTGGTIRILPYNSGIKLDGKSTKVMLPRKTTCTKSKIISVQPKLITATPVTTTSNTTPCSTVTVPDINSKRRIMLSAKEISVLPQQQNNKIIYNNNNNNNNNVCHLNNVNNNLKNLSSQPVTITHSVVANNQNNSNNNKNCNINDCNNKNNNNITSGNCNSISDIKIEPIIPPSVRQEIQMRVLKRQQRMIKNRESACLSRKKKKEYVSSLENRVADLENENAQLKMENSALKEQLNRLESNLHNKNKVTIQSPNVKKTSVLLALILILSVNLGSISLLTRTVPELSQVDSISDTSHHSRSLLWTQPDLEEPSPNVINSTSGFPHGSLTCPLNINQTESLRLNSELRKWIGVEELSLDTNVNINSKDDDDDDNNNNTNANINNNQNEEFTDIPYLGLKLVNEGKKLKQLMLPDVSTPLPSRRAAPATVTRVRRKPKMQRRLFHEVDLLGTQVEQNGLLHAIRRRDDTFYVVSFSGDHLLLPAIAHNNTLRPKMSLVLPSLHLNGTLNTAEPFTMMQIDCEVLDTRLVELKEADIPPHLRTTGAASNNQNDPPPQENMTDSAVHQRPYRPYFMRSHKSNVKNNDFSTNNIKNEGLNTDYASLYNNARDDPTRFP